MNKLIFGASLSSEVHGMCVARLTLTSAIDQEQTLIGIALTVETSVKVEACFAYNSIAGNWQLATFVNI